MFSACAFLLAGLSACATGPSGPSAQAELKPTQGNSVSGQLRFVQTGAQVQVSGEVRGLKPNAEHGFHIHEKGDCSSGDGMSTGGHFNPSGAAHGQHGTGAHHSGDLPALVANAQGVARIDFTSSSLSLQDGPASIVGKGLIVHRDPDDYRTQPTGNSGPRVACAVIQKG
ncbi:superoxide dismutase family protein [Curvibacter sp. RS43]|uniref:Superoxide dismutase [Cu-Zn] n=2 Tax=Curvibacter microcysteis TaxID=3026419 RepID=A0ABT5MBG0_9BURK|nr:MULTISPECIES: superoxide dismutase family protein [unclassified Curvibacter]MDD0811120.1 superoxide dismutase family protein [Curvibacter sp. RS43]MDD0813909.1 superoxide dismutase family protein [Curvibacter sp. HBC28]